MTLNIIGIDEDPTLPSDQFWTAAADLLIQIASVQPKMGQAIDAVIDDGGDIEITAHNQAHIKGMSTFEMKLHKGCRRNPMILRPFWR